MDKSVSNKYLNLLFTVIVSLLLGAAIILLLNHNPLTAYYELLKGAFVGKLNIGTTIQKFIPLLITSLAFTVSSKAGAFNVGVEGEMYLGAMAAAIIAVWFPGIPPIFHIFLCFFFSAVVGAAWAYIPGVLKAYLSVNEIMVTILMNYVAKYLTSYLVNGPFSAKTGIPQTKSIADNLKLPAMLKPSQAHRGVFIAIIIAIVIFWIMDKTSVGYKLKTVGLNPFNAEYVGINPKSTMIKALMISGAMGGIAGCIEVLGTHGYFLDNFSSGIAMEGMLASLIVKNDMKMVPIMAFFLAVLKTGALGMERNTGVPKSIIDTLIAIFIVFATTEGLFSFVGKKKTKKAIKG